jgi:hypothetical protein
MIVNFVNYSAKERGKQRKKWIKTIQQQQTKDRGKNRI